MATTQPSTQTGLVAVYAAAVASVAQANALAADIMPFSRAVPAFTPDTVSEPVAYPATATEVAEIELTALATAPTQGTVAFTNGSTGAGNTLLSAATYALSGLTANTKTTMTLTGTAADLQVPADGSLTMTVDNNDQPFLVKIRFSRQ